MQSRWIFAAAWLLVGLLNLSTRFRSPDRCSQELLPSVNCIFPYYRCQWYTDTRFNHSKTFNCSWEPNQSSEHKVLVGKWAPRTCAQAAFPIGKLYFSPWMLFHQYFNNKRGLLLKYIMSSDLPGRGPQTQAHFGTQSSQLDTSPQYSFLDYNTQDTATGYPAFTQASFMNLTPLSRFA